MRNDMLFYESNLYDFLQTQLAGVQARVDGIGVEQFLASSDEQIVEHVGSSMEIVPLELYEERKTMEQWESQIDVTGNQRYLGRRDGGRLLVPGQQVIVYVPFTGNAQLWKMRPNHFNHNPPRALIKWGGSDGHGTLEITLTLTADTEADTCQKALDGTLKNVRFYLTAQKEMIEQHNRSLPDLVRQAVAQRRKTRQNLEAVRKVLNIPMRPRDGVPDVTPLPVKRKLVRPLPTAQSSPAEYGIDERVYEHILAVIRHEGRTFEATPSTFAVHDEEGLRDIVLAHLNGYYEGDAAGEAFRKSGKTDIKIEFNNRAAFVAECKVWRGEQELSDAIDQLLGYLTWRDCKVALIVFNKDVAGFSGIQTKVPVTLKARQNYRAELASQPAGEWRYRFHLPDDKGREITVHVFLFNLFVAASAKATKRKQVSNIS